MTDLSCHCLPLILISKRYRSFFHYNFEWPIILKLCLWVSYNSQNYAGTLGSGLFLAAPRDLSIEVVLLKPSLMQSCSMWAEQQTLIHPFSLNKVSLAHLRVMQRSKVSLAHLLLALSRYSEYTHSPPNLILIMQCNNLQIMHICLLHTYIYIYIHKPTNKY